MIPSPADLAKVPRPKTTRPPRETQSRPDFRHRRGEVWLVVADPEKPAIGTEIWSNRPAIVVSNNVINAHSGFAQIVYLSTATRKRSGPLHVPVTTGEHSTSMALCEQIHTVDVSRLRKKLHQITPSEIRDIDAALTTSLSIGMNPDTHGSFRKWEEHIKLHGIDMAKEIDALSGLTTDQRVESLSRAFALMTIERDSYRALYESALELPIVAQDVERLTVD